MTALRPIPAKDMVGRVCGYLGRLGFVQTYKSKSGSRYLRLPPEPFTIRISDHHFSLYSRQAHPQVVRSVALQPVTEPEVYLLSVEMAVRYLAACEIRRIQSRCASRRRRVV